MTLGELVDREIYRYIGEAGGHVEWDKMEVVMSEPFFLAFAEEFGRTFAYMGMGEGSRAFQTDLEEMVIGKKQMKFHGCEIKVDRNLEGYQMMARASDESIREQLARHEAWRKQGSLYDRDIKG